jgi:DNA primase
MWNSHRTVQAIQALNIKTKGQPSPLKKNIQCHCPYHKDNTPSMGIKTDTGQWNCFQCGKNGNLNQLAKDLFGMSIYEMLDIKEDGFSDFIQTQYVEPDYSKLDHPINIEIESFKEHSIRNRSAFEYLKKK